MALVRLLTWVALLGGEVCEGFAPHYSKGLMTRVAARRDMAPVGCMVSSPVYPLGTWLYVYGKRTGVLRYCEVVDVSHPKDRRRHIATQRWVELDEAVTEALCGSTRQRVVDCPIIVIRMNDGP